MTRRLSGLAAIAVCVVVVPAPASAQGDDAGGRRLTLADYMEMESVSNPQISPDGRQIVYTRGWVDQVNDSRESSLWIMNADGSRNRHLIEGTGARWSPDGTRMLYTARGEPSGSQVFVRWMDAEGATSQITRLEHGPSSPRWSPDGQRIAFTSRMDDQAAFAGVDLPGRPDGAKWTGEPKVVERAGYKRDRAGYIDTGWTHLFVVPADGGTARQLTDGDWNHEGVAWSVDGAEIYFSSYRADDWDRPSRWQESEIYAVDVATERIRQLTDRRGSDRAPVPSPDGRLIAYIAGDEHRDTFRNPRIWVMSPDGSNPRLISGPYDRQSGGLRWAPDGRGLYFSVRRDGYQSLHFVALDGGVTQFTDGAQLFSLASFADDGTAVGTIAGAHEPGDLYRFDLSAPNDVTRLTEVNADVLHDCSSTGAPAAAFSRPTSWAIRIASPQRRRTVRSSTGCRRWGPLTRSPTPGRSRSRSGRTRPNGSTGRRSSTLATSRPRPCS